MVPLTYGWYERMVEKDFIRSTINDVVVPEKEHVEKSVSVAADVMEDTGSLYIRLVQSLTTNQQAKNIHQ